MIKFPRKVPPARGACRLPLTMGRAAAAARVWTRRPRALRGAQNCAPRLLPPRCAARDAAARTVEGGRTHAAAAVVLGPALAAGECFDTLLFKLAYD